jgi:hypothetical protein
MDYCPKQAISNHLNLFETGSVDFSVTNSIYVPCFSQTIIKERGVPLEFLVCN